MSDFWPKGLELSDTESPMIILERAQNEWNVRSKGILTLVLQKVETESGNDMIIIHAKHVPSNRTAELFSVVHRPNIPYPVTIQPKSDDLPTFLKKSYYEPSLTDNLVASRMLQGQGRRVENMWVSETPSEFRESLEQAFNLGIVRSEVLNLISVESASTSSSPAA